jgi:hypothetical protein
MRGFVAATLAISGALAACSLLVSLDGQQCSTDSDCMSRGGAFSNSVCANQICVSPLDSAVPEASSDGPVEARGFDGPATGVDAGEVDAGPWGCLSQPPEVLSASQSITVTLTAFDALQPITTAGPTGSDLVPISYTPVPGASVEACRATDPACSSSVATGTMDEAGVATFTTPGTFVGFLRLSAPGYFPSTTYPGQLVADASMESIPTAMLGVDELQLLAFALGVPVDTGADSGVGHAFFEVYDCYDHHAAGVTFALLGDAGAQTQQWYTRNGAPSTTANETDSLGAGGAVNVPAGGLTVTATLAATNQPLGTINAIIAPGETVFGFVRVRTH